MYDVGCVIQFCSGNIDVYYSIYDSVLVQVSEDELLPND